MTGRLHLEQPVYSFVLAEIAHEYSECARLLPVALLLQRADHPPCGVLDKQVVDPVVHVDGAVSR